MPRPKYYYYAYTAVMFSSAPHVKNTCPVEHWSMMGGGEEGDGRET